VETDNPNACTTVNWSVCKSAIALYCLHLSVIKRECVTEVLINPTVRTRTRHFVPRTILHVTICFRTVQWPALVSMVMDFWLPQKEQSFLNQLSIHIHFKAYSVPRSSLNLMQTRTVIFKLQTVCREQHFWHVESNPG
jgi:hypothetical protein